MWFRNIRKKFDNLFSLLPSPFKSSLPNQTTGQPYIYFSLDTFDLTCILIEIIPCCAPVKPEKIVANSGKILLKFVREWVRNLTALILQYWAKREMKTLWLLWEKRLSVECVYLSVRRLSVSHYAIKQTNILICVRARCSLVW